MPDPQRRSYQQEVAQLLQAIYLSSPIHYEWNSSFGSAMYCPQLDLAVGPFVTDRNVRLIEEYDALMVSSRVFIEQLIFFHLNNMTTLGSNHLNHETVLPSAVFQQLMYTNQNSRCFLAFEIENRVSRKHLMGGAINAAALGRIGLAIAWSPDKLKAFVRLKKYLDYLTSVKKNAFNMSNLLILDKDHLQQAILSVQTAATPSVAK